MFNENIISYTVDDFYFVPNYSLILAQIPKIWKKSVHLQSSQASHSRESLTVFD